MTGTPFVVVQFPAYSNLFGAVSLPLPHPFPLELAAVNRVCVSVFDRLLRLEVMSRVASLMFFLNP